MEVFPGAKVAGGCVVGAGLVTFLSTLFPASETVPYNEHVQAIPTLPRKQVLSGEN